MACGVTIADGMQDSQLGEIAAEITPPVTPADYGEVFMGGPTGIPL
jgi:hypothetical protein